MDNFYSKYSGIGGGGGVTSLNGLTGALTLIAGSGISITPGVGTLTIAATGGSFALQDLSNLTPTAINQSLIPNAAGTRVLGSVTDYWGPSFINQLNDSGGLLSADFFTHQLDNGNGATVNWNNQTLIRSFNSTITLDWDNCILRTNSGSSHSLDWANRQLIANDGSTVIFDWSGAALSANTHKISNVVDPTSPQDVATKNYVDTSGGGGANQSLSNLTSPTALNQILIFDTGGSGELQTKDDTASSQDLLIATGSSSAGASGNMAISTGAAANTGTGTISMLTGNPSAPDINSGSITIASGDVTGIGVSGIIGIHSGDTVDGTSANVNIRSGTGTGNGGSGDLNFISGSGSASTGTISILSGDSGLASSGNLNFATGNTADSNSGQTQIVTGNTGNGTSGPLNLGSGNSSGTGGSGNVLVQTGTTGDGTSGSIFIATGGPSGNGQSGAVEITSADTAQGNSGLIFISSGLSGNSISGAVTLVSGEATLNSGDVTVGSGDSDVAASGNLLLKTGAANTTRGAITLDALYMTIPTGAADPTAPAGSIYYNTGSNTIRWFNGTTWADL